jgi:hypothetical protein
MQFYHHAADFCYSDSCWLALQFGGLAYLVPALILCLSVSCYAVAITVRLTGLTPNVLVYDAKVLFVYLISIGSALIVLTGLAFFNPWYPIVSNSPLPAGMASR